MLCGKISQKLIQRQDKFWKQASINKSSFLWSVEIINRLWKIAWSIWSFRCDFAYSPQSNWETHFKRTRQEKILFEYQKGPKDAKGKDRRWWKKDLSKLLKKPPHYQDMWLLSVEAVRQKLRKKYPQFKIKEWFCTDGYVQKMKLKMTKHKKDTKNCSTILRTKKERATTTAPHRSGMP